MGTKTAGAENGVKRPAHWDKRVSAAYLRIMGKTQKQAAEAVGRNERTLREWEGEDSWAAARAEAEERWCADGLDLARQTIHRGVRANPDLAKWFLERVDPRFAPPKQRTEHTGRDGGPIQTEEVVLSDDERAARIAAILDGARARRTG